MCSQHASSPPQMAQPLTVLLSAPLRPAVHLAASSAAVVMPPSASTLQSLMLRASRAACSEAHGTAITAG
jgi:hypothetical protein